MTYRSRNKDVTSRFVKANILKRVTKFGHIFIWGDNSPDGRSGIIGDGTTISRSSPVQLQSSQFWKEIDISGHTLALKTDGTLWSWGRNEYGQLGTNTSISISVSSPVQIGSNTWWKYVVCGLDTTFAIRGDKDDGRLYSWGSNDYGILGINSGVLLHRSSPVQIGLDRTWKFVNPPSRQNVVTAIKTDGTLWIWGQIQHRLGFAPPEQGRSSPVQFDSSTNWKKIAGPNSLAADIHFLAIKTDGTLWGWGSNGYGQLGLPLIGSEAGSGLAVRSSPTQISNRNDWTEISVSQDTSFALKEDGTLWAWGRNEAGVFGNNQESPQGTRGAIGVSSPVQIVTDRKWSTISSSKLFTPYLSGNNTIAAISNLYY